MISVIILNWNGEKYLSRCLDAVAAQTFKEYEVLVLDNASTDGSADGIENRWPGFQVVRFEQNLGFAAANNRGVQLAQGHWVALLNNDAFPEPDWLANLAQAAQEHPDFSLFASCILQAHDTNLVQDTGDIYHISGLAWARDANRPIQESHQQADEVFSPCAAAALYDRTAFLSVGGFDETFVSHHEDVDLGFRLRLLGKRCLYVPDARVAHIGSASYGIETARTVYQVQRNVIWAYFADMPGWLFWKYLPAHMLANMIFLVHYSLRGYTKAVWRAKLDALRSIPAVLRKRQAIQKQYQNSKHSDNLPAEIDKILDHHWASPYTLGKRAGKIRRILHISSQ